MTCAFWIDKSRAQEETIDSLHKALEDERRLRAHLENRIRSYRQGRLADVPSGKGWATGYISRPSEGK